MILVDEAGERTVVNLFRAREPEPPARILDLAADGLYVRSRALDLAPLLAEKVRSCLVVAHVPPCQPGARPAQVLLASEADLEGVPESPWDWGRGIAGEVLRWVVLTRGPDGAVAFGADQRHEARPPRVDARDTTGAGDAFAAGLIHALVSGTPIPAALEIGCSWGAAKAARDGSVLDRDIVAGLL
jgi:sugar/nucleoside kinase (ribokinase family)